MLTELQAVPGRALAPPPSRDTEAALLFLSLDNWLHAELVSLVVWSLLEKIEQETWRETGISFVTSVTRLMERLLDYRYPLTQTQMCVTACFIQQKTRYSSIETAPSLTVPSAAAVIDWDLTRKTSANWCLSWWTAYINIHIEAMENTTHFSVCDKFYCVALPTPPASPSRSPAHFHLLSNHAAKTFHSLFMLAVRCMNRWVRVLIKKWKKK